MDIEKASEALQALTRPLVTIIFTVVLSRGFLRGQVSGDAFLTVVGMVIVFWFKDREAAKDAATTKAADKLVEKMTIAIPGVDKP